MVTSHHPYFSDKRLSSRRKEYSLLEPCEVFTEEEWIRGGLRPWIDNMDESDMNLVHVDGTQDEEAIIELKGWRNLCTSKPRQRK
jgi:hypothetical protein